MLRSDSISCDSFRTRYTRYCGKMKHFPINCVTSVNEIDGLLGALRLGADPMSDSERPCRVCGFGKYQLVVNNRDRYNNIENFGFTPKGTHAFKVFVCDNCGNVQLFSCQHDSDPPGWTGITN